MKHVDLHVITADSYGTAVSELAGILVPHRLRKRDGQHDVEKREYVEKFVLQHVAAFGNGNNDRLLLRRVKNSGGLAIAVDNGEGCAIHAVLTSHVLVVGAVNALNILLEPKGCKGCCIMKTQANAGPRRDVRGHDQHSARWLKIVAGSASSTDEGKWFGRNKMFDTAYTNATRHLTSAVWLSRQPHNRWHLWR